MVKIQENRHSKIIRNRFKDAMEIFGRTNLILRVVTRTVDQFGQLSNLSTADTTFTGDLQFGLDLDKRYISTGIVEIGDAVLYIKNDALSTLPNPRDQVVDGNAIWEIVKQMEAPELGGDSTFYTYRCKRRINASDV